jgi:hypothetical protein
MANCSIPNSSPASGRISTRSLRRSRKQNSQSRASVSVIRRSVFRLQGRRQVRHLESVRWRTAAFAIRRVKGAWWPSRSSKPSSPRKWQGRFDSYPLRPIFSGNPERSAPNSKDPVGNRQLTYRDSSTSLGMTKLSKGGGIDVA